MEITTSLSVFKEELRYFGVFVILNAKGMSHFFVLNVRLYSLQNFL